LIKKMFFSLLIFLSTIILPPLTNSAESAFGNPVNNPAIYCFVANSLEGLITILLPVVVLLFIVSGLLFTAGRGDPTRLESAKKFFFWTVISAVILLGLFIIKSVTEGTVNAILGDGTIIQRDCKTGN
jgi:heme/copper-type cytochrome/quinol oxidase subunit 2